MQNEHNNENLKQQGARLVELLNDGELLEAGKQAELIASTLNLDLLAPLLGDKLEREALAKFHRNDDWCIKGTLYDWRRQAEERDADFLGKLRERFKQAIQAELGDRADGFPVDELLESLPQLLEQAIIEIVESWQASQFDPLQHFRSWLKVQERSQSYIDACLTLAGQFVARNGRKRKYSESEILSFMAELQDRYSNNGKVSATYTTQLIRLKSFLRSLGQDLPIRKIPAYPDTFHQPTLSKEQVEALIYAAVLNEKPDMTLRLLISTIYACRVGELSKLTNECFDLEADPPVVEIPVEKRSKARRQPIPKELVPFFKTPLAPRTRRQLERDLKRIAREAGLEIKGPWGWHSIRRCVVSLLFAETPLKELEIVDFLRWRRPSRQWGVLPTYVKTPKETGDLKVLRHHPFVPFWTDMVAFLPYLEQWQHIYDEAKIITKPGHRR